MAARELPAFRLRLEALSSEAAELLNRPAGVWDELGERSRLGGAPSLHNEAIPNCRVCGSPMTFYAQLDGLPRPSEFDLADAGLILVFVCFDCFEVHAMVDSA